MFRISHGDRRDASFTPPASRFLNRARMPPGRQTPSCWWKRSSSIATVASWIDCGIFESGIGVPVWVELIRPSFAVR